MPAVSSPCVKICVMDTGSGLCQGCGRTLDEISRWAMLDEPSRRAIMARLPARLLAADRAAADVRTRGVQ